jgi:hypothetical protein
MTSQRRQQFLAGERPDDVHIFVSTDAVSDPDRLADTNHGEKVRDGVVLVLDGERGRAAFESAVGIDPMALARDAMGTEGEVHESCTDATCPNAGDGDTHSPRFTFAFAEEQSADAGGLYAEGDVIHCYVACACGLNYSDKWVAGGD